MKHERICRQRWQRVIEKELRSMIADGISVGVATYSLGDTLDRMAGGKPNTTGAFEAFGYRPEDECRR